MMRNTKHCGVRIEPRDLLLFQGLFECRVMERRAHIAQLYYGSKDPMAKERIGKKLLPNQYVVEQNPRRHPTERARYGLGWRGFEELKRAGVIEEYERRTNGRFTWERLEDRLAVSASTVRHEISVMDAATAIVCAIRREARLAVIAWSTWPLLSQFKSPVGCVVKPDGFFSISRSIDADSAVEEILYLEVDRATETHATLAKKVEAYDAYSGSSLFSRGMGAEDGERVHFRTLFVFAADRESGGADERRNSFLERLARSEIGRSVAWTATMDDLVRDPLGEIWITPLDYAQGLAGTHFDPRRATQGVANRSAARDALVRERVRRRLLFPPREVTS